MKILIKKQLTEKTYRRFKWTVGVFVLFASTHLFVDFLKPKSELDTFSDQFQNKLAYVTRSLQQSNSSASSNKSVTETPSPTPYPSPP